MKKWVLFAAAVIAWYKLFPLQLVLLSYDDIVANVQVRALGIDWWEGPVDRRADTRLAAGANYAIKTYEETRMMRIMAEFSNYFRDTDEGTVDDVDS